MSASEEIEAEKQKRSNELLMEEERKRQSAKKDVAPEAGGNAEPVEEEAFIGIAPFEAVFTASQFAIGVHEPEDGSPRTGQAMFLWPGGRVTVQFLEADGLEAAGKAMIAASNAMRSKLHTPTPQEVHAVKTRQVPPGMTPRQGPVK